MRQPVLNLSRRNSVCAAGASSKKVQRNPERHFEGREVENLTELEVEKLEGVGVGFCAVSHEMLRFKAREIANMHCIGPFHNLK
jgi:hypothetical protein